jgi:glycerol-3-phosphate dehydrogenase
VSGGAARRAAASEERGMDRAAHLHRIRGGRFDAVVIGGGITGAGVALDAAARGLSVALVERGDFAQGTSSWSTKLVHGGLRYLPMLDIVQVREGLEEQRMLFRNAPHLVRPLPFVLPLYRGARRPLGLRLPAPLRPAMPLGVAAGLWVYDHLAVRERRLRFRRLSPAGASGLVPPVRRDGLRSAFLYYDGQTDDARLTLAVLRTAAASGAALANHVEAVRIDCQAGRVAGVRLVDRLSGDAFAVRAGIVINAGGVWAESVAALAGPPGFRIRRAKGVHLVCGNGALGMRRAALVLPETDDGRIAFLVPWHGAVVVGTTDTEANGDDDQPEASPQDVAYLLDHAARFLIAGIDRRDVIGVYAGLRPLVSAGRGSSAALSRRHAVVPGPAGFYSIIGGKLTTYRRMAEEVVNAATGRGPQDASPTRRLCLAGAHGLGRVLPALRAEGRRLGLSGATLRHLLTTYGTGTERVLGLVRERPELGCELASGQPHIAAEVVVAVREEMAVTIGDVLFTRTRLAHLLPDQGRGVAPSVAAVLGQELGWGPDVRAAQIAAYVEASRRFAVPRRPAPAPVAAAAPASRPAPSQAGPAEGR